MRQLSRAAPDVYVRQDRRGRQPQDWSPAPHPGRCARAILLLLLAGTGLQAQTSTLLRSHVEFLASDAMKGRTCPSPFCDVAAEYILTQLRAAGLATQVQTSEPSADTPAQRNVIGVLKGRDPLLRDTYVLVTAHYDHVGEKMDASGDSVYNGANDNASSVAALIEIARAMAASPLKPRRSVAFIAYFGEEKGLIGSRYYASHPVFPIEKTYAQINMEQLGRTDDSEGPRVKGLSLTGWDRSEVGALLAASARRFGVTISKHPKFSEEFFERSDNEALAKLGVPSHTVAAAFAFPDYHGLGDSAEKLDYASMTALARALRAGIFALANRTAKLTLREGSPAASAPESGSSPATPKPPRPKPSPKPQPR